jgi:hypothetical protein
MVLQELQYINRGNLGRNFIQFHMDLYDFIWVDALGSLEADQQQCTRQMKHQPDMDFWLVRPTIFKHV